MLNRVSNYNKYFALLIKVIIFSSLSRTPIILNNLPGYCVVN
ncbi:hypothetical protein MNBD_GAMMA10-3272 [hydrothermal vent metagenome]|uniref:Uncharacterized protein n=1 Tax=hydrothermal vent metagenome TaxID=652676 RepID=A0A3B0XPJ0_9ZZZZ